MFFTVQFNGLLVANILINLHVIYHHRESATGLGVSDQRMERGFQLVYSALHHSQGVQHYPDGPAIRMCIKHFPLSRKKKKKKKFAILCVDTVFTFKHFIFPRPFTAFKTRYINISFSHSLFLQYILPVLFVLNKLEMNRQLI